MEVLKREGSAVSTASKSSSSSTASCEAVGKKSSKQSCTIAWVLGGGICDIDGLGGGSICFDWTTGDGAIAGMAISVGASSATTSILGFCDGIGGGGIAVDDFDGAAFANGNSFGGGTSVFSWTEGWVEGFCLKILCRGG